MKPDRLTQAPRALRRPGVKLENVALVPGTLLPDIKRWQRLANELPAGSVLVCLPVQETQQRIARRVVAQLRSKGTPESVVHVV